MVQKDNRAATDRRGFLKFAGLGSVASAAALVSQGDEAEAAKARPDGSLGYRETEHVRTYYESTRY